MKFKRSLLRRLIIGQLMVVIVFSLIAMGNVVWQIYRKDGGAFLDFERHAWASNRA